MVCTFFGHRDAPESLMPRLEAVLTDLIAHKDVTVFYVGDSGAFDCRNEWMIAKADYVVAYAHYIGGARQYRELALKRGKTVIDLV